MIDGVVIVPATGGNSFYRRPRRVVDLEDLVAYYKQTFTLSTDAVDEWTDELGANDLTPSGISPGSKRYHFGGHRGVENTREMDLASSITPTLPYEIWFVIDPQDFAFNQRILQNADGSSILQLRNNGQVRSRINSTNNDLTPVSTITVDGIWVVRVIHGADNSITCEVNGTLHDESVVEADAPTYTKFGFESAQSDSYVGAIAIFDDALTAGEASLVRGELADFRRGTFASVGASNTNDANNGEHEAGGVHGFHSTSGYNSRPLWDSTQEDGWWDKIGDGDQWTTAPWLTFRNELSRTGSAGHPHVTSLWVHVMLNNDQTGSMTATEQGKLSDIIDAARQEIIDRGHNFSLTTDIPVYVSPLASYTAGAGCTLEDSPLEVSADLVPWAVANLTNVSRGPDLVPIGPHREEGGSPCHARESGGYQADDGWALRSFFEGIDP